MAIYPDKKQGKLTGRWRVELQKTIAGTLHKHRKRHDSHAEAVEDEQAVLAAWERGEPLAANVKPLPTSTHHSIGSITQEAKGVLWDGQAGEASAWAHIRDIGHIVGMSDPLNEIDTLTIDRIANELKKRKKADGTINRYLSHFRTFLVWARDRKHMSHQAFAEIVWAWKKETSGRIRWITDAEEAQLKKFLPDNVWRLVKVAIETGCRRDELLTAELDQINGNRLHLWDTKTDSPRTVPMSPETTKMLADLIVDGNMPTRRGLRSWWARAQKKMGLERDELFVFHICRHTCATRLLDAEVDILVIKEWLGHKRLETTQRYTHVKPKNLEAALAKVGKFKAEGGDFSS